ncbi:MAG: HPr family phosphocarrier protein, partial [Leptonema sp. (in: Bacteria)]|nr:HPr family phosphocarrier protein [Leptonema sp. (in: bacteria)]
LLSSGGTTANGKSIMGILMLALSPGTEVELQVHGPDEEIAIQVLTKVLLGNAE